MPASEIEDRRFADLGVGQVLRVADQGAAGFERRVKPFVWIDGE